MPNNASLTKRLWKFAVPIILLSVGIGFATSQAANRKPTPDAHLELDKAFDAYQKGLYEKANEIWQRLADRGIVSAQINLAALYESGRGVAKDPVKAAGLYRTAAAKGNQFAQYNLALMLMEGQGVSRDLDAARMLLEKAANQKMASAFYQLGLLHAGLYDAQQDSNDFTIDKGLALNRIYAGGLIFDKQADTAGLEKTIAAMVQISPGDRRIAELNSKLSHLLETDPPQKSVSPSTNFGTAWPLENGYVVTNYHVIAGSDSLTLQNTNGRQVKARPVIFDRENDLALLAVEDTNQLPPALPLCKVEAPKGTSVFTMGYPRVDVLGFAPKFTDGIIDTNADTLDNMRRYLTTVDIQPGNSGGPLLNKNGEVVGVVSANLAIRDDASGELHILPNQSCAIKVGNLHRLIGQLPEKGVHRHAITGQGLSYKALQEKIKHSVMVVIAQGENG